MTRPSTEAIDATERQQPRRSVASIVGSTLLNLAAVGGVVCIVLVILATCFNITLIMFKTGSMSPTIPTGSLALVREIPASDIAVGDVVTVDRAGQLPVTHRVTSVTGGVDTAGPQRTITMQGDANLSEDPEPYTVSTVRIVLASVPGLAYLVVWLSNPWVLAGLTLSCSALVMWAFWPRSDRKRPPGDSGGTGENGRAASRRRSTTADGAGPRPARHAALRCSPVALLLGAGLAIGGSAPAQAEPTVDVIAGEAVVLTSIGDPSAMRSLAPGRSTPWEVGISTKPEATPGSIDVTMVGSGSPELGLVMVVDACSVQWTAAGCVGTITHLFDEMAVPVDGVERAVLSMRSSEAWWLKFDVRMPSGAAVANASVALTVTAEGIGDDVSVSPGPITTLPRTGASIEFAVWTAAGAILIGLVGAWFGALRQHSRSARGSR
ncbi:signal peptidase, endoplasmic reticulum-type [Plantibacter sp. VKM Ac-1784]|uniref:Signal peptidase I n=2 Tax=Plantibacter TaxID=190323 RepID=A0ABY1RGN5_9MICO|nr:signal peptidase I [Plantibacter sp. VKM Ac-1784]SMQ73891.1 signal peptidase, endoplasmic reticulum-type [Plantibacter sp. VKM Ac-1784]